MKLLLQKNWHFVSLYRVWQRDGIVVVKREGGKEGRKEGRKNPGILT
jgi:hypothetical protein